MRRLRSGEGWILRRCDHYIEYLLVHALKFFVAQMELHLVEVQPIGDEVDVGAIWLALQVAADLAHKGGERHGG